MAINHASGFIVNDSLSNQIAFCLNKIKKGNAQQVVDELLKFKPELDKNDTYKRIRPLLNKYYNHGYIMGKRKFGHASYQYELAPIL